MDDGRHGTGDTGDNPQFRGVVDGLNPVGLTALTPGAAPTVTGDIFWQNASTGQG